MHPHNDLYGANEVYASYAGLSSADRPPSIPGHLQHGWRTDNECLRVGGVDVPLLVWSQASQGRLRTVSKRPVITVGAPWNYVTQRSVDDGLIVPDLPDSSDAPEAEAEPDNFAQVWFLSHGLGGPELADRWADLIAGHGAATAVVLPPGEQLVDAICRPYDRRGISVRTLGVKVRPFGVTGPNPLEMMWSLIRDAHLVGTSGHHPASVFAASLGKQVGSVDRWGQASERRSFRPPMSAARRENTGPDWSQLRRLAGVGSADLTMAGGNDVKQWALDELGPQLSPLEIRQVLGWSADA